MSKLGFTKAGNEITARACGEDNSGVVYRRGDVYVLSTSIAFDLLEDGTEVYEEDYTDRDEAVQALKLTCGYHG